MWEATSLFDHVVITLPINSVSVFCFLPQIASKMLVSTEIIASRKVVERDWRIVVVPDEEASGASVLLISSGCGLQNKIKMRIPHGFSFKNCLRNNEFYLCGLTPFFY